MDAASLGQDIRVAALTVGLVLGTLALFGVCYAWLRNQTFGVGGAGMSVVGTALLGLSLWQSLEVSMSDKGVSLKAALITEQLTKRASEQAEHGAAATEELRKRVDEIDASLKQLAQRSEPPTQADIAALAQSATSARETADQAAQRWQILQDTQAKILEIQDQRSQHGPRGLTAWLGHRNLSDFLDVGSGEHATDPLHRQQTSEPALFCQVDNNDQMNPIKYRSV
jgi:hypothetical protein